MKGKAVIFISGQDIINAIQDVSKLKVKDSQNRQKIKDLKKELGKFQTLHKLDVDHAKRLMEERDEWKRAASFHECQAADYCGLYEKEQLKVKTRDEKLTELQTRFEREWNKRQLLKKEYFHMMKGFKGADHAVNRLEDQVAALSDELSNVRTQLKHERALGAKAHTDSLDESIASSFKFQQLERDLKAAQASFSYYRDLADLQEEQLKAVPVLKERVKGYIAQVNQLKAEIERQNTLKERAYQDAADYQARLKTFKAIVGQIEIGTVVTALENLNALTEDELVNVERNVSKLVGKD